MVCAEREFDVMHHHPHFWLLYGRWWWLPPLVLAGSLRGVYVSLRRGPLSNSWNAALRTELPHLGTSWAQQSSHLTIVWQFVKCSHSCLFSWFQKGIYLNFNLCMNFKTITYLETLLWEIPPVFLLQVINASFSFPLPPDYIFEVYSVKDKLECSILV